MHEHSLSGRGFDWLVGLWAKDTDAAADAVRLSVNTIITLPSALASSRYMQNTSPVSDIITNIATGCVAKLRHVGLSVQGVTEKPQNFNISLNNVAHAGFFRHAIVAKI